ncbi:hypothetical protein RRG08_046418 [Elysia crispata]|uniref:Uncharacterized protein n=1 Tax=Elysia crispata TaxID=231223 RepID=A0AAE0Z8K5_9GAST|nr:hypothetical protein RRG08_046418 [Elysia crispata]
MKNVRRRHFCQIESSSAKQTPNIDFRRPLASELVTLELPAFHRIGRPLQITGLRWRCVPVYEDVGWSNQLREVSRMFSPPVVHSTTKTSQSIVATTSGELSNSVACELCLASDIPVHSGYNIRGTF